MSIEISGFEPLQREFRDAASKIVPEVRKAVQRSGSNVKDEASTRAPDVLGADRVTSTVTAGGNEVRADVETRSPLGAVLEFGSPTLPGGRPFMAPALETEREPLPKAVDDIVGKLLP